VGRVARTHGIRGHVLVNPETDFVAERFHGRRAGLDAGDASTRRCG
jgi:ribosomal 30S subunit maturation factor RimM